MASNEIHRPQFHFLPPANWMNDPNGLIHWKGQYHLFYQYNPNGAYHGTIHWGHAVSPDLVHWKHLPIALTPGPGGPDKDGCWSGCVVDNQGTPTMIYTGVFPPALCIAWSEDDLVTWVKHPGNPVLSPPPELDISMGFDQEWRDPWVWKEDVSWNMLIGSGINEVGGAVLLYQSKDLIHWEYQRPLLVGEHLDLGAVWECPSLISMGERHILLISTLPEFSHTYYLTGAYTRQRFDPAIVGKTDFGRYFYAAQPLRDEHERWLMWGWIKEGRDARAQQAAGWSGVMSLPRVLDLFPDGRLGMAPAPELALLRDRHGHWENFTISPSDQYLLDDWHGRSLEIIAEFEPGEARMFGLWVCCSPDHSERTLIACDVIQQQLIIDRSDASLASGVDREPQMAPLRVSPDQRIRLHLFIDGSVIEVFADGHVCITSRVYPTRAESVFVELFALDGDATIASLDIWTLKSIWTGFEPSPASQVQSRTR